MDLEIIKGKVRACATEWLFRAMAVRKRLKDASAGFAKREYTMRDGVILLVVAIILGAGLKAVAADTFTIGYEDYRLKPAEALIDIDAIQKEMIKKGESMPVADQSAGASCSE